ncbi:MAG: phosphoribosylformylglycinamidine synthase II, partial [Candidatus Rokuibacteriota bacterium]
AIGARLVRAAHDCAEGGLAVALGEGCVSGPAPVGVQIELPSAAPLPLLLFGEGPSRIVVAVRAEGERHFERLMGEFAVPWRWIGRVGGDRLMIRAGGASVIDLSVDRSALAWRSGFERYVG